MRRFGEGDRGEEEARKVSSAEARAYQEDAVNADLRVFFERFIQGVSSPKTLTFDR
jgi:hypothetical protein